MYFQELKNLKICLSSSTDLKDYELRTMNSAIDSLDFWLITRSQHTRKRLNPLQFANDVGLSWDIAAQLFELSEKEQIFTRFYELWSEDLMECLIRTDDIDEIVSIDEMYNSMTDEYEDVDIDFVNIWYKLLIIPKENYNMEEKNSKKALAPTFSPYNVVDNINVSEQLGKIFSRKGRST